MAFHGSETFSMVNIEGSAISEDSSQGSQAQGPGDVPDPEPKQCCSMSTTLSERKREMMWRAQSLTVREGAYGVRFLILGMDVVQVQPEQSTCHDLLGW